MRNQSLSFCSSNLILQVVFLACPESITTLHSFTSNMFVNLILISTAIFSSFTNFNYQHFEESFKNEYIAKHEIKTLEIPFTSQAPFGEWTDKRQQDGCEETSVLMTMFWIKKEDLTPEKAKEKILQISEFEEKNYGHSVDTSAQDTLDRIINGYFNYKKAFVKRKISKTDILFELAQGNAVIVPANGKLLKNPYFTPPGPDKHMLVLKGYDKESHEFITNDPGTKMGKSYRYNEDILFNAISDYPTGDHEFFDKIEKVMIVIKKT